MYQRACLMALEEQVLDLSATSTQRTKKWYTKSLWLILFMWLARVSTT